MIKEMILILHFPFLDGHVPRATHSGVYIFLIRFSLACNNVKDFNEHNICIRETL
jgi:hypothetical protein